MTRRRFLVGGSLVAGGLALYGGEIERHWIEITHRDVFIPGLPQAFDGFRIAQLSDIHMDEYTEPFFLRDAVRHINSLNPDVVFLTGDFVTNGLSPKRFAVGAAWQCANLLNMPLCCSR
jgi:predicted MPP superfamily phosphohydrolase